MTSDRIIVNLLREALAENNSALNGMIATGSRIQRILDSIEHEDETKAALLFKYDLEDHIEGIESNSLVQRTERFKDRHNPEGYKLSDRDSLNLARLAREIQSKEHTMRPEFSMSVLGAAMLYSYRLGYIRGWEAKGK